MEDNKNIYSVSEDTAALVTAYKTLADVEYNVTNAMAQKYMEYELVADDFLQALTEAKRQLTALIGKNIGHNVGSMPSDTVL